MKKINEFVNTELRDYALYTVFNRAIPSFEDGLKPSARKVLYTAIKKGLLNKEIKTIALSGDVISFTGYHHGDTSLSAAISRLASDYIPVNNYPLMIGDGFGSRINPYPGSPRYTFVRLSEYFKKLYNIDIDYLDYIKENKLIKDDEENCYDYFLPLIPQVLFNGVDGIAKGFAVNIYPRRLEDLTEAMINIINGKPLKNKILPYFKGFNGKIGLVKENDIEKFYYKIDFKRLSKKEIELTEISPFIKTEKFEEMLEKLKEKNIIKKYINKSKVNYFFKIEFSNNITDEQINKYLKLYNTFSTDNVNLIKDGKKLVQYNNIEEYLAEFVKWRLSLYDERKKFILMNLNNKMNKKILELQYISEVNKLNKTTLTKDNLKDIINKLKADELKDILLRIPIYSFTKEEIQNRMNEIKNIKIEISNIEKKDFKLEYLKELKSSF